MIGGGTLIDDVARRPTTPNERRLAVAIASLAAVFCLVAARSANPEVGPIAAFLPALGSATIVATLATAAILRNRYRASGEIALAYLSVAYGFSALATVPYVLDFPGVFSAAGPAGGALRLSPWCWTVWHAGFLLLLAAYGFVDRRRRDAPPPRHPRLLVRRYVATVAVFALLAYAALYFARDALPPLLLASGASPFFHVIVRAGLLVPSLALLVDLVARTRLRRSPDLWLAVVITLAFCEIYVGGELAGRRFTATWYAGRLAGLAASAIFLAVQLRLVFELLRAFGANNRMLAEIAQHDGLTGLLNRGAFDARFEALWNQCRRGREPISLLVLDLDYFKPYNDCFGHLAGDEALRRVGRELADATNRPTDLVCRIGGEEFAIVLPFTNEEGAAIVAERVVRKIRALALPHAPGLPVTVLTVSVGAATARGNAVSHRLLQEHADAALYHAKRAGRDRVGSVRAGRANLRAV